MKTAIIRSAKFNDGEPCIEIKQTWLAKVFNKPVVVSKGLFEKLTKEQTKIIQILEPKQENTKEAKNL